MATTLRTMEKRIAAALYVERTAVVAAYQEELDRGAAEGRDLTGDNAVVMRRQAKRYGQILAPYLIDQ